jgi:hypothetical protein
MAARWISGSVRPRIAGGGADHAQDLGVGRLPRESAASRSLNNRAFEIAIAACSANACSTFAITFVERAHLSPADEEHAERPAIGVQRSDHAAADVADHVLGDAHGADETAGCHRSAR